MNRSTRNSVGIVGLRADLMYAGVAPAEATGSDAVVPGGSHGEEAGKADASLKAIPNAIGNCLVDGSLRRTLATPRFAGS